MPKTTTNGNDIIPLNNQASIFLAKAFETFFQQVIAQKNELEKQKEDKVFTLKEAAAWLKISDATLSRMVRDNEIPFVYVRENLRFSLLALEEYIRKGLFKRPKLKQREEKN